MVAEGYVDNHIERKEKILGRTLTFGQIGRVSMGALGTFLVDTSIVITQIGFCVGYFIFLGNTTRSVVFEFLRYQHVAFTNTSNSFHFNTTNATVLKAAVLATSSKYQTAVMPTTHWTTTTNARDLTSPGTLVVNISDKGISVGPTNFSLHADPINLTTPVPLNATLGNATRHEGIISAIISKVKSLKDRIVKMDSPITHNTLQENKAWTFTLLLAVPGPLLVLIAFIRNLRKLGPISVLANGSITGAFLATGIYILVGEFDLQLWCFKRSIKDWIAHDCLCKIFR